MQTLVIARVQIDGLRVRVTDDSDEVAKPLLQVALTQLTGNVDSELTEGAPPSMVLQLDLTLHATYMNSSTAAWEPLLEPWPVSAPPDGTHARRLDSSASRVPNRDV